MGGLLNWFIFGIILPGMRIDFWFVSQSHKYLSLLMCMKMQLRFFSKMMILFTFYYSIIYGKKVFLLEKKHTQTYYIISRSKVIPLCILVFSLRGHVASHINVPNEYGTSYDSFVTFTFDLDLDHCNITLF